MVTVWKLFHCRFVTSRRGYWVLVFRKRPALLTVIWTSYDSRLGPTTLIHGGQNVLVILQVTKSADLILSLESESHRVSASIRVSSNRLTWTHSPKYRRAAEQGHQKPHSHQKLCTIAVPTDYPPTKSEFAAMLADKLGYDLVFILVLLL